MVEYTVLQPEGAEEEVSDHVDDFVEKAETENDGEQKSQGSL